MELVVDTLDQTPQILDPAGAQSPINPRIRSLIRGSAAEATDGKTIFVCGVAVGVNEVANPEFLLPAVLVAASQAACTPANPDHGKAGFTFYLEPDKTAVLGVKVSNITVSSPRTFVSSIMDALRRFECGGEHNLDDLVTQFGKFVRDELGYEMHPGGDIEDSLLLAVS